MKQLLFSMQGRIRRGEYWKAVLILFGIGILDTIAIQVLAMVVPGVQATEGGFSASGAAAVPMAILGIAYMVFVIWTGICVSAKRCHDRGRSGWFMLLAVVPLLNLWYMIEVMFLPGTPGPNRFGPDPLGTYPYGAAPLGTPMATTR